MSSDARVNRRRFLTVAAGAGAASVLAACGNTAPAAPAVGGAGSGGSTPAASTSAPAAAPTSAAAANTAPSGGASTAAPAAAGSTSAPAAAGGGMLNASTKVYVLLDKGVSDTGSFKATDLYNQAQPMAPQILMEDAPDGWDTKVLAQIKDKSLRWSGHGYIPYFDQYKRLKSGMIAPLDDLLQASKISWAHTQKDQYFTPRVYDSLRSDNKQYYIPMKINVHMAGYRLDYVQAAGYDALPKTWDEIDKMLPKMKAALAKDEVIPFAIQNELWRAIGTTFSTFVEKPLDDMGVFKIESPEWMDMLTMFKKWTDAKLARYDITADSTDIWQKGKIGMSLGSQSWVRLGRQVWGPDKVKGAVPPQANASAPPRTWAHIDSSSVLTGGPNPAQAMDWLLSIYGPEGVPAQTWYTGTLTFSGSPIHQTWIDKLVTPNKDITEIGDVLKILPNSQIASVAQANGFGICQVLMPPYLDRIFKGELSVKDAMTKLRGEIDAEFAKQKA